MNAFSFGNGRTGKRVILRGRSAILQKSLDDLVDDNTILGVHADQPAALPAALIARKIVASSAKNTPGYAMNNLKLVTPDPSRGTSPTCRRPQTRL